MKFVITWQFEYIKSIIIYKHKIIYVCNERDNIIRIWKHFLCSYKKEFALLRALEKILNA